MTAAVVIHEFWTGGAILGAAVTPVVVALTSEALRRPLNRAAALREQRRAVEAPGAAVPAGPPAPDPAEEDRFGIWEEPREPWHRRLGRRRLRAALLTGLLAFAVGAVALTGGELVFGGSLGSGGKRTTLVPDRDRDRDREREERPADDDRAPPTTEPEGDEPAPEDDATTTPDEPEPESTTQTEPAPAPGSTAPAPGSTTPAPGSTAPAPAPSG